MAEIKFYENAEDELLRFAVIISKSQNKFIFCKHKERDTWELPGGHRENGEKIIDTAKRELLGCYFLQILSALKQSYIAR